MHGLEYSQRAERLLFGNLVGTLVYRIHNCSTDGRTAVDNDARSSTGIDYHSNRGSRNSGG